MLSFQKMIIMLCIGLITACGGTGTIKKTPATDDGKGGYYLDDGPGSNPPANLDSIPDAELKSETPLVYPNKPYSVMGKKYTPMQQYAPYKQKGVASWYGKRYHGRKTSSGEVYDMYTMSGAHTILPIPSYVRVINLANKRSVIVRINDRGPFKHDRLIDLSYAAAHRLGLIAQGSGMVEVEWIDTSPEALKKLKSHPPATSAAIQLPVQDSVIQSAAAVPAAVETKPIETPATAVVNTSESKASYFVQVGAFKNEANGDLLQKKVLGLDIAGDAAVTKVYNDGIYRIKLGPYPSRKEADLTANKVRRQLNTSAIVINQ
jgi:rare lipoprotein A